MLGFVLIFAVSCSKTSITNVEVEINCTGTYLVVNSEFYLVCNPDVFVDVEDGERVNAKFITVENCEAQNLIICQMAFPVDETIEVLKIN